jgi:hypothetical protein
VEPAPLVNGLATLGVNVVVDGDDAALAIPAEAPIKRQEMSTVRTWNLCMIESPPKELQIASRAQDAKAQNLQRAIMAWSGNIPSYFQIVVRQTRQDLNM